MAADGPAFCGVAQVYDERFQAKYGFWRPVIERSVTAFLKCGDLHEGFARVRCGDCQHEMFVAFSCKQRCTCPSCHQKRALLTALHVAEEVCSPVPHRQVVFTIPKRLRLHSRFDRSCWASSRRRPGRASATKSGGSWAVRMSCPAWRRHPDPRLASALASAHPCAGHLRRVHAARRVCGTAGTGQGAALRGLAGGRARPLPGRGQDRTGSGREHAQLAAQRLSSPCSTHPGLRKKSCDVARICVPACAVFVPAKGRVGRAFTPVSGFSR